MHQPSLRLLMLLVIIGPSSGDIFTSTEHLNKLLSTDSVLHVVKEFIAKEEGKIAYLKKKLELLEDMRAGNGSGVSSSEHPIGVYHILRAYYDINSTIHNRQSYADYQRDTTVGMPTSNDLYGATLGIARLQNTFKLLAFDLIRGKIGTSQTRPLEPYEAYHIGLVAFQTEYYNEAMSWMRAIYEKYNDVLDVYLRKNVLMHLAYCYEKEPDVASLQDTFKLLHKYYPNDSEVLSYQTNVDKNMGRPLGSWVKTEDSDIQRYRALCRGDPVTPVHPLEPNWAVCRYIPLRAPYDRVKEETLSIEPFVKFYYDVIMPKENSHIKLMTTKKLETSKIGFEPEKSVTSNIRVSKTAWLWDSDHVDVGEVTYGISKRIGRITGLNIAQRESNSDAEAMQVVNYGIGGQYEPHLDTAPEIDHSGQGVPAPLRGSGDRIATFLIYLSDVEMGGSTVYPRAGIKVDAVKNGALLWYNTLPSGDYDWLTLHAGCPVLLGQKWIANKWFRTNGQMFRRPCGLQSTTAQATLNRPNIHTTH